MYWSGGDGSQFRPVPAAPPPPPPRGIGGTFMSPTPSLPPHGHPPPFGPTQGRPPVMQQPPMSQHYTYPPPAPQPPHLPPPGPLRSPVPSMHLSMQPSLPSLQRPLLPSMRPNMPPSLPPPRPLLQQPLQAGFQSMQPSPLPVSAPFQSPLLQVPPHMYFPQVPSQPFQPGPFLPPLPPSPPLENPPPPPPASPPPLSPAPDHGEESIAILLPPEPPKPTDPEILKNIDVLASFVVKNGPRFESMARARQAGDPKFAFLFESDAAPEAAIGHEFYKWKKQCLALELGLVMENKKNNQGDAEAVSGRSLYAKGTPPLHGDFPVSPAMSDMDMDMEDDFSPSPTKEPMSKLERGSSLTAKECGRHTTPTIEGRVVLKDATMLAKLMNLEALSPPNVVEKIYGTSLVNEEEQMPGEGRNIFKSHKEVDPTLHSISNPSGGSIDSQSRSKVSQDAALERQERHVEKLSNWEASVPNEGHDGVEDSGDQKIQKSSNPTHDNSVGTDQILTNGDSNIETGNFAASMLVQEKRDTDTIDEFGRMAQKESGESESEGDMRPRKRRRSSSRSRSRNRNRNKSRSRSRSGSHSSGDLRWKRQGFSRSPARRVRGSRSRSRSPHWHRNDSQSPSRDRWEGVARGDRDWRNERQSYGRGRRDGRGVGPPVCLHYARGRCFRGSACKFLHPERETGQEPGVQSIDGQSAGSKNQEPTTNRPGAEVHGGKDECMGQGTISVPDKTDVFQAAHTIESEDGKNLLERPTFDKESEAILCNSASESIEQPEKPSGEHSETGRGVDEPREIEVDADQPGLVKNNLNMHDSLEVENTKRDIDVKLKSIEESENKATGKGIVSPNQHSELATNVILDKDRSGLSTDVSALESKAEKADLSSGFEEITPRDSEEGAVDEPAVESGANLSRMPSVSGAPVQRGSLSPLPSPQVKAMTISLSASMDESFSNERSVLASKPLEPVHSSSPAGNHVSSLASPSVSIRSSLPLSQQMPFSSPPLHGTLHNQSSHGTAFLPLHGPGSITPQQPIIPPQDRLLTNFEMHHPGQFSSNYPILQQLGNPPHSGKEPWDLGARFSSSKEESTFPRLVDNNMRQYTHSYQSGDVLQHAYPMSNIVTSSATTRNSLSWSENAFAASRSTLSSNAERYSYTLTTIPPLPSLMKLPGGSQVANSSDQYDPLSDGLELGPSGDGRSLKAGVLENVSPGLDSGKATALAVAIDVDTVNVNEAAADVGVVENVSPPGEWSPLPHEDAAIVAHDHVKSKKSNRGLKLLRTAVADRVKVLLKPAWKEGRLSKDAFKTIAKKAVEKVTGNLPSHHIPKSQEKVDQFMSVSGSKISKLVQGYIDKYSKV